MTVIHDPENNQYGDCQRACVASLLELNSEDVPHFYITNDDMDFFFSLNDFLSKKGFIHLETMPIDFDMAQFVGKADVYHLIYGTTVRGTHHATVGLNGEVVHDPHPSKAGLCINQKEKWTYAFLVPVFGE